MRNSKLQRETISRIRFKHGDAKDQKHITTEYWAWRNMKNRCYYKKSRSYPDYGGRGITVCEEWRGSYAAFLRDVGRKPTPEHTLNRLSNDRGYEPGNVEWATPLQQSGSV